MRALVSLALMLVTVVAVAEVVPTPGGFDSRIRTVTYNADDVVRLKGFVGYEIHLEFAFGEEFVNLAAGDTAGIDVGAQGNHLLVKPKQPRVGTNLTVLTNRHVYHFDYSAERLAATTPVSDIVWSIRFVYPAVPAVPDEGVPIADALAQGDAAARRNENYWFCGDRILKPVAVFDDGVRTTLKFGARADLPAVFLKNEDRSESLVNFSVEHDQLIVHRVAPKFVLRRGSLVGCLENRGYESGTSERSGSGTVSPNVERRARGEDP